MLRRWLPLVLALVVGAAPIAREICEVSCAGHSASTAPPPAPHQAHAMAGHDHARGVHGIGAAQPIITDAAPPVHSHRGVTCDLSWAAGPHACGHGDESQAKSAPATTLQTRSPAIVAQVQGVARPDHEKAPFVGGSDHPFIPIPISLRTPLRV